ncbi:RNA recognition motif 2-domain-containing protein [Zalerion maritima]|uniref:RNA recognition motif 2-domain-containing protein n=1 Tax=Zalerion maritima TaxID=339359 RepID=A0AAD5WQK1_9PEZI|nr:RNA recognition motif 2-domain-containing protein [Zalerion maritima]
MSTPKEREVAVSPNSPQSSAGAGMESTKGTPDTRLSAFSPDGIVKQVSMGYRYGLGVHNSAGGPVQFGVGQSMTSGGVGTSVHSAEDPFVGPGASSSGVGSLHAITPRAADAIRVRDHSRLSPQRLDSRPTQGENQVVADNGTSTMPAHTFTLGGQHQRTLRANIGNFAPATSANQFLSPCNINANMNPGKRNQGM